MTRQQISKDVKDFVTGYIRSVFHLEVLLLLHGAREKWWVPTEVSQQLGIEIETANTQLLWLTEMGLLRQRDKEHVSFIYNPKTEELKLIIDRLAKAYSEQRVAVFSLILKRPDDRMQRFAEAFKVTRST